MELAHLLGTEQQKHEWLEPLLAGPIRSAFAMTEPDVAFSDATNIGTHIDRDGDEYVVTATVDVVNGSGRTRLAATDSATLTADGYAAAGGGNTARRAASSVEYGPGDADAAAASARAADIATTTSDAALPAGQLRVVLGTDYRATASRPTPATTTASAGDAISGGGIPCVK